MEQFVRKLDLIRLSFITIFLYLFSALELIDPDFFWHLKTGHYLIDNQSIPEKDIFSYTYADQPWVLHEWLFQLLLAYIDDVSGELGIKIMVALLVSSLLIIIYVAINGILKRPVIALGIAVLTLIFISSAIAPRPQLFTFIFFAIYLRLLIGFKYSDENRGIFFFPPLMLLWVNSHGGYSIGLILLVLFSICEWVKYVAQENRDEINRHRLSRFSLLVGITFVSSLLNPYFIDHWFYPFHVMSLKTAITHITEWQSPNFHQPAHKIYLVLVFLFFLSTIYQQRKADLTEIAIPIFFITLGFISIRHIPLAAITLAIFSAITVVNRPFAGIMPSHWITFCETRTFQLKQKNKDLGDTEYIINWILLGIVVCGFIFYRPVIETNSVNKPVAHVPDKAVEFILDNEISGRMFNHYNFGGYLIARLHPEQKVFIDGRADMYGDDFFREFLEITGGHKNWEKLFDKHRIDYVLIRPQDTLRYLLLLRGDYVQVFEDDISVILVKNNHDYADVIAQFSHQPNQNH